MGTEYAKVCKYLVARQDALKDYVFLIQTSGTWIDMAEDYRKQVRHSGGAFFLMAT